MMSTTVESSLPSINQPALPKLEVTEEVRFAVVMYGGISLAIYMNGIAQELLHLVRSTSPAVAGGDTGRAHPSPTEKVYRKLGQMMVSGEPLPAVPEDGSALPIKTRFVIDILSGSSAGGINAVFLAKALANDQELSKLKELWVTQGDIAKLLNDKGAAEGNNLKPQKQPVSLLSGQRMYLELVKALEGMEGEAGVGTRQGGACSPTGESPHVAELDLFVTATDMQGQLIELQLSDKRVTELRHRNLFHFVYSTLDPDPACPVRNDFARENNPFLAFAARCTSAHPAAFNPMTLGDIAPVLQSSTEFKEIAKSPGYEKWQKFYAEYLRPSGDETKPELVNKFLGRNFNDGGVLDNQPFGPTLDTLPLHFADLPVTRKLVYIEPAPENPPPQGDKAEPPDFVENAWLSLSTLPRYEPIRQHLQTVLDRNRLVERIRHITEGIELDVKIHDEKVGHTEPPTAAEFGNADIVEMIGRKGEAWGGYQRLRVAEVTDDLTLLITRLAGFDEHSDEFQAIRYIVRSWRMGHYSPYNPANESLAKKYRVEARSGEPKETSEFGVETKLTENMFLMRYDLAWRLRRLRFVLNKIDDMACFDARGEEVMRSAQGAEEGDDVPYPRLRKEDENNVEARERQKEFRQELIEIKKKLTAVYKSLRVKRQQIWSGCMDDLADRSGEFDDGELGAALAGSFEEGKRWLEQKYPPAQRAAGRVHDAPLLRMVGKTFAELKIKRDPLLSLLERFSSAEERDKAVVEIMKKLDHDSKFRAFANSLALALDDVIKKASDSCNKILRIDGRTGLPLDEEDGQRTAVAETVLKVVRYYYRYFDTYDMIAHPILYATQAGDEVDMVEVFRISPQDATAIINEQKDGVRKLSGTKLSNFGAFFRKEFRVNDILWGRLDGAERIISALLPGPEAHVVAKRKELIEQAHHAIIKEELGVEDTSELHELLRKMGSAEQDELRRTLKDERVQFALGTYFKNTDAVVYFKEKFLKEHASTFQFDNQDVIVDAARASKVFGKMLDGYADKHQVKNKQLAWVSRVTGIFYGLVEVAIPNSIPNLLLRYWLQLLYLFEFLTVLFGMLLLNQNIQHFGLLAFGLTATVNGAVLLLQDIMRGSRRDLHLLVAALISVGLVLVMLGGAFVAGLEWESAWHLLVRFRDWYAAEQRLGMNLKTLVRLLVVLVVLAFFVKSVMNGRRGRPASS